MLQRKCLSDRLTVSEIPATAYNFCNFQKKTIWHSHPPYAVIGQVCGGMKVGRDWTLVFSTSLNSHEVSSVKSFHIPLQQHSIHGISVCLCQKAVCLKITIVNIENIFKDDTERITFLCIIWLLYLLHIVKIVKCLIPIELKHIKRTQLHMCETQTVPEVHPV